MPGSILSVAFLIAAIAPGYLYLRVAERRRSRPTRSALVEMTELAIVGVVSTTISAGLVFLLAARWSWPPLVRLDRWASGGSLYLREEAHRSALTAAAVLLGSFVLAAVLGWFTHRALPKSIDPGGNVWSLVLRGPGDVDVFAGIQLRDGSAIEGYVLAFPEQPGPTDGIALQAPILINEGTRREVQRGIDAALVRFEDIASVGTRYESRPRPPARRRWWHRKAPAGSSTP